MDEKHTSMKRLYFQTIGGCCEQTNKEQSEPWEVLWNIYYRTTQKPIG